MQCFGLALGNLVATLASVLDSLAGYALDALLFGRCWTCTGSGQVLRYFARKGTNPDPV
jgi:hypothetical protein